MLAFARSTRGERVLESTSGRRPARTSIRQRPLKAGRSSDIASLSFLRTSTTVLVGYSKQGHANMEQERTADDERFKDTVN